MNDMKPGKRARDARAASIAAEPTADESLLRQAEAALTDAAAALTLYPSITERRQRLVVVRDRIRERLEQEKGFPG